MRAADLPGAAARGADLAKSILRPLSLRAQLRAERHLPAVPDAIDALRSRWDIPPASDDPILLVASAWRSGSTLLQRMIIGSGDVLVWGEPWNRTDTILRLAESLRPLAGGWPHHAVFLDDVADGADQLKNAWVANLFPEPSALIESHRALFRTLYSDPAQQAGYERWGLKLVRLGIDAIAYFRLLFPEASIVFIYRNPYDSWASYRAARVAAYERFPQRPVFGPLSFGRLWAKRVDEVLPAADQLGVLCVRYEDLVDPTELLTRRLEDHLGLELDWSALDAVVGSTNQGAGKARHRLYAHERRAISWTAGRTARALAYEP